MKRISITSLPIYTVRPLRILKQVLAEPKRYSRPWYVAYLLLGIVTAGMLPVLLPLMMSTVSHNLSHVSYVMGVYDLGLLSSPLWGILAERRKQYRRLFLTGFLISTLAIGVFPFMHSLLLWMVSALLLGIGSSGAATMASLLIINFEPSSEWEPRIGMLQCFNGTGQVVGLLLAGIFSHGTFSTGLWIAAGLLAPALVIGRIGLPAASVLPRRSGRKKYLHRLLDMRALAAFPHSNLSSGVSFHFHALNMSGLRRFSTAVNSGFGRIILSWFMLALGVAGFFTYFPLMLANRYGLNSHSSSVLYAAMAAIGIPLFVLASRQSAKLGVGRVYQFGLWFRLIAFVLLFLPYVLPVGHHLLFGTIGFCAIVLAWPVISVSGTNLAAYLAPFSEGAAMGLFNATWAAGTVLGAFASGPLIAAFGYQAINIAAIVGVGLSIAFSWHVRPPVNAAQAKE